MKLGYKGNKVQFVKILLFLGLFYLIVLYLLPIRFEENDDLIMNAIASGDYAGIPDPHMVFINFIYGYFLNFLYNIAPIVDWYPLFFIIFHIISSSIILTAFLNATKSHKAYKLLALIPFLILSFLCFIQLQFTTTAALISLSAIVLMMHINTKIKLWGIVWFFIASLIRFEAVFLTLLIISPYLLFLYFKQRKTARIFISAILLAILGLLMDKFYYKMEPEWSNYKTFNHYRGQINDNPNAKLLLINQELPKNIGINDYSLLLQFFPDPGKIDLPLIKKLHQKLNQYKFNFSNINMLEKYFNMFVALLILIMLTLIIYRKHSYRWILFAAFTLFLLVAIYISLNAIYKPRVLYSSLFPLLFIMVYLMEFEGKKLSLLIYSTAIVLFSLYFGQRIPEFIQENQANTVMYNYQKSLFSDVNGKIVVFQSDLTLEGKKLFERNGKKEPAIVFAGWMSHNPLNNNYFSSFKSLLKDNTFLFLNKSHDAVPKKIIQSLLNNYNIKARVLIYRENEKYLLLKFETFI